MKKKEFYYDSADGVTKIHGIEWIPEGKPVLHPADCPWHGGVYQPV